MPRVKAIPKEELEAAIGKEQAHRLSADASDSEDSGLELNTQREQEKRDALKKKRADALVKAREVRQTKIVERRQDEERQLAEAAQRQQEIKERAKQAYEQELHERVKREAKKLAKKIALKQVKTPDSDSESEPEAVQHHPPPAKTVKHERYPVKKVVVEQPMLTGRALLRSLGL